MAGLNTTVAKYPIEEWNKVMNLNLNSVFTVVRLSFLLWKKTIMEE